RHPSDPSPSEITPRELYLRRREFLAGGAAAAGALLIGGCRRDGEVASAAEAALPDEITPREDATSYNNFYELGPDKTDPRDNAHRLRTRPWSVSVEGEVARPGTLDIEDVLRLF